MKSVLLLIGLFGWIFVNGQTIKVAAASNLRYVLDDIIKLYSKSYPNTVISITYGSSGILTTQILNGADFDFFMSADTACPIKLNEEGMVYDKIEIYAYGSLALWSNTLNLSEGIKVLENKSISRIAIAKPQVAPYGAKAIECLNYYGLYEKLKAKLVYTDNVAQTIQYAQTGNADIAFTASSLVISSAILEGNYLIVDPVSYVPIKQTCVVIKTKVVKPEVFQFKEFVLSDKCGSLFIKYGYITP